MRFRAIQYIGIFLLGLQGCVSIPKHEIATVSNSLDLENDTSDALDSNDFTLGAFPNAKWWEDFDDPTLSKIIEEALSLSPTLSLAEERLKAALQNALDKRSVLFPTINFIAEDLWTHLSKEGFFRAFAPPVPAVVNDTLLGLTFTYEIDFWGKYRDLFKAAVGEAKAFAAEKKQAELILTTSIAYTYTQMQFFLHQMQLLEEMERNKHEIDLFRKARHEGALDNSIVQLQSRSDTLDVDNTIAQVEQELLIDLHQIKSLSGLGQDADLEITFQDFKPLITTIPENISLDLIARRPDLMAQKARVEAAAKQIDAAKTDFYPNVNLGAFVGLESVLWSKIFQSDSYFGIANPAINLPIFNAGRIKARLMEKVAEFNEAVYQYNGLILDTAQEVVDRLSDVVLLQKQIEITEKILQTSQTQAALTRKRFENAIDTRINVLDSENVVIEKALALAQLQYSKQMAAILLIRALGGGFQE